MQSADDAQVVDHAISNGLWSGLALRQELPRSWSEENLGAFLKDEPAMAKALALYLGLEGPQPAPGVAARGSAGAGVGGYVALEARPKLCSIWITRTATRQIHFRFGRSNCFTARTRSSAGQSGSDGTRPYRSCPRGSGSVSGGATALFKPLLGLLVVSLFAIGCIGLTVAIWRMVSHQQAP